MANRLKRSGASGRLCRWIGTLLAGAILLVAGAAAAQDFKVTLLGTGSPFPLAERFGMSTLVEAGGEKLLFDVGRGATIRLWQVHVPLGSITATFISHFHSRPLIVGADLMQFDIRDDGAHRIDPGVAP